MGDRRATTQESIVPLGALKPMGASMPFSRGLCRCCTKKSTSTSVSSTVMGRPQPRRKVAAISDERGHKHFKGDKVVANCSRHCNVIAPFVSAPGNRHESPLLQKALPQVTRIAHKVGLNLKNTIVSLDSAYDSRANRKAIFNRGMMPNIPENPRGRSTPKRGRQPFFNAAIYQERFFTTLAGVRLGR